MVVQANGCKFCIFHMLEDIGSDELGESIAPPVTIVDLVELLYELVLFLLLFNDG